MIFAVFGFMLLIGSARAQMPNNDPMQAMPSQAMPMQGMPMQGMPSQGLPVQGGLPMQGMPQDASALKHAFAATIATVLHGTGTGMAAMIVQGLGGAIQGWFQRLGQRQPPGQTPPLGVSGTSANMNPMASAAGGAFPQSPQLYAGLAFEVHALAPNGSSRPVDPEAHTFATGDRFVVFYRPTLPGRIAVLNVNPLGQERQIDDLSVAAGELARMGPYEFRDQAGDELLRLILTPCRSDQLIATTRSIVKVDDYAGSAGASDWPMQGSGGMPRFSECSALAVTTRGEGVRTRDIAKVEMDGSTLFALDAITSQEMSSGQFAPREITIRFRHR